MTTISTHEAKTHLSRYLAAVERGEVITIARGRKPVARLVPVDSGASRERPKVGETLGPQMPVSDEALRPLTADELKDWGL
jgi:prevent-host-death family protein